MYKIGSLFSGLGAFEQAFKNLNIPHEIIFACEIDKYAQKTFLSNFRPNNLINDIRDIKEIPDLDFLAFGSPCTDLSQSGLRDLSLGRSSLVINAINLILKNPPKYIIFENVKSILDKKNKDFYIKEIWKPLEEKYVLQQFILNPINFGIPHHRERLFLIGQREDLDWKELHDLSHINKGDVKFGDIEEPTYNENYYLSDICLERIKKIEARAKLKGYGYKDTLIDKNGIFKNLDASYAKGPDGKRSVILDSLTNRPRMATMLECKRLMGFSDDFNVTVSRTQGYKQFGNSICVKILEEIIEGLTK
jgi:DNA (cytosine-5)-methyltransferase 1